MTTIENAELVCGCCGMASVQPELMSTSRFGSSDLDMRPPPPSRDALPFMIHCCPECGYCARHLSTKPVDGVGVVQRIEYRAAFSTSGVPGLAQQYLALACLERMAGDHRAAFAAAMSAAWVCDDERLDGGALHCRKRALDLISEAGEKHEDIHDTVETTLSVAVDINRRCGFWVPAEALVEEVLSETGNELIRDILQFQRGLVSRRDLGAYTVEEALAASQAGGAS